MAIVEVVPLTYNDIKQDITNRFTAKGYDATYEGSNASILTDVISYVASTLNLNTAFNTSEMLLSTATQDKNVRYLARQLGFEGQNIISYQYNVRLLCNVDTTVANTVVQNYSVPKYTKFTSGAYNYYSISEQPPLLLSNNDITNTGPYYIDITVKEGILYLYSDIPSQLTKTEQYDTLGNILNYIDIPISNIEDNGIDLLMTYTNSNNISIVDEPWYKADQFLIDYDVNMKNKFIRIEDIEFNIPRLYFKIAGIGNDLVPNTSMKLNVITSNGNSGVATTNMVLPATISNLTFVSQTLLVVGQAKEDMESIRLNAPLFHNSANRAVTKYDYVSITNRHSSVKYSQVWGGEEEIPKNLGYIYFSFVPQERYTTRVFSTSLNNTLYTLNSKDVSTNNFIKNTELSSATTDVSGVLLNPGVFDVLSDYNMIGMQFLYRHPIYIDFDYTINIIKYNNKLSRQVTQQKAFDILNSYFLGSLEQGEVDYFHSNIIKRIDTEVTDLSGLNCVLNTSITLYPENINTERSNTAEKSITFFLAVPYNTYVTSTNVIQSEMPQMSATISGQSLYINWNNLQLSSGTTLADAEYFYFPIELNGVTVGRYLVHQKVKSYIRIDLYIKGTFGTCTDVLWTTSTLTESMFDFNIYTNSFVKLNLGFLNNNIKIIKNSYPRLTTVRFL